MFLIWFITVLPSASESRSEWIAKANPSAPTKMRTQTACKAVNLHSFDLHSFDYSTMGSVIESMPIYDQDGTGACYAYAATQLTTYWLRAHGKDEERSETINPIYAAWVYSFANRNRLTAESETDGGLVVDAIRALKENGYCEGVEVDKALQSFKDKGKMTDAQLLFYLQGTYSYDEYETPEEQWNQLIKTKEKHLIKNGCDQASVSQAIVDAGLNNKTANEILGELFKDCEEKKKKKLNLPNPFYLNSGSDFEIKREANEILESKTPVGLGLCSNFFKDHGYRGIKRSASIRKKRASSLKVKSDCRAHSVLLTAKKPSDKTPGACQYLIRNSWGANWHPNGTDCACITSSGYYQDKCSENEAREFVGCWFEEGDLIPNVMDLTWIPSNGESGNK